MRKLAMLAVASLCLGTTVPAFAQGQAAPQTGLPPGAGIGATNAGAPPPTGRVTTMTTPAPMAPPTAAAPMDAAPATPVRRARRHRVRHHAVRHATPAPAVSQ